MRRSHRLALLEEESWVFSKPKSQSNSSVVPLPQLSPPSSPVPVVAKRSIYQQTIDSLCRYELDPPQCISLTSSPHTSPKKVREEKLSSPTHHTPGGTSKSLSRIFDTSTQSEKGKELPHFFSDESVCESPRSIRSL
jgi:hypothetical protein